MHYFVTLQIGDSYSTLKFKFERGVETEVSKEDYDYLTTVKETYVKDDGNRQIVVTRDRFEARVEEPTKEEKILAEVEDTDPSLTPRKPGRPKAE